MGEYEGVQESGHPISSWRVTGQLTAVNALIGLSDNHIVTASHCWLGMALKS